MERGSAQQTRLDKPPGLRSPAVSWLLCPTLCLCEALSSAKLGLKNQDTGRTQKSTGNGQASQLFFPTLPQHKRNMFW